MRTCRVGKFSIEPEATVPVHVTIHMCGPFPFTTEETVPEDELLAQAQGQGPVGREISNECDYLLTAFIGMLSRSIKLVGLWLDGQAHSSPGIPMAAPVVPTLT